ncbi:MAG: hypothetical protein J0J01_17740 [Reyranella sp.]|uniref:hypothetical protein n=1 Tax=Reyranella sp. TaxID=1929291 RepID=UPI001AD076F5|nr:hypothetical protein [Reyranella sp.]MBN9088750.1 hypothetical protein [Reyranella sp.]
MLLIVLSITTASPGQAEPLRPSMADVEQMLPKEGPGYKMPYYHWPDGAPISVSMITSRQQGPCVNSAFADVRTQIDPIRRDVPALRNLQDAQLVDRVLEVSDPQLLLVLPTDDSRVVVALENQRRPQGTALEIDRSYGLAGSGDAKDPPVRNVQGHDGFVISDARIVHARRYTIRPRGMSAYADICRKTDFSYNLYNPLGGESFSPGRAADRLLREGKSVKDRWHRHADRMFLLALHSCSEKPAARECLVKSLYDFLNDSRRTPVD